MEAAELTLCCRPYDPLADPTGRYGARPQVLADRGFKRGAVPEAEIGSGPVRAFEKRQQRRFRVG